MRNFTRTPASPAKSTAGFTGVKPETPSQVVLKKVEKAPEPKPVEWPVFKPGHFVKYVDVPENVDESSSSSGRRKKIRTAYRPLLPWGCEAGIVLAQSINKEWCIVLVNRIQDEFEYNRSHVDLMDGARTLLLGRPKWMLRRVSFVSTLFLAPYDVQENTTFPIMDLPLPALAIVLHSLPGGMKEASWASMTCKRFLSAFRHELVWKQKTLSAIGPDVVVDPGSDWFSTYRDKAFWTIRVVTMFGHRGGTSISGEFSVHVDPKCTVAQLLNVLNGSRQNRQACRGPLPLEDYRPHNPAKLRERDYHTGETTITNPKAKPNCRFDYEGKDVSTLTIADAGLCDGAILEVPEMMKRD